MTNYNLLLQIKRKKQNSSFLFISPKNIEIENEIVLFENQAVKLEVNMKVETVWLNALQIAELFDRNVKTIRKHINNAINEELSDTMVVAKFASIISHGPIEEYRC